MTHLANKGENRARILAGLFDAVCENVQVLIKPGVSPRPVVLIGGVSRSRARPRRTSAACSRDTRHDAASRRAGGRRPLLRGARLRAARRRAAAAACPRSTSCCSPPQPKRRWSGCRALARRRCGRVRRMRRAAGARRERHSPRLDPRLRHRLDRLEGGGARRRDRASRSGRLPATPTATRSARRRRCCGSFVSGAGGAMPGRRGSASPAAAARSSARC